MRNLPINLGAFYGPARGKYYPVVYTKTVTTLYVYTF